MRVCLVIDHGMRNDNGNAEGTEDGYRHNDTI